MGVQDGGKTKMILCLGIQVTRRCSVHVCAHDRSAAHRGQQTCGSFQLMLCACQV